jgi:hypothetical protein
MPTSNCKNKKRLLTSVYQAFFFTSKPNTFFLVIINRKSLELEGKHSAKAAF